MARRNGIKAAPWEYGAVDMGTRPMNRVCQMCDCGRSDLAFRAPAIVLLALLYCPCMAGGFAPTPVRSRNLSLEYRLAGAPSDSVVDLWYTRDRGRTWFRGDDKGYSSSPIPFRVPAEGLYGWIIALRSDPTCATSTPPSGTQPQRWVFVDATPPLVQWDAVEPAEDFTTSRRLHLRWTAYDSNLPARPISLAWQSSIDQIWHVLEEAISNTGRYDWTVPENVAGQLTLSIAVCDEGEHVVERMFGPFGIDEWMKRPATAKAPTSQPASQPTSPDTGKGRVAGWKPAGDAETQRRAEKLYQQGSWYLLRGEYGIAAERFRESLEHDPDMLDALNDPEAPLIAIDPSPPGVRDVCHHIEVLVVDGCFLRITIAQPQAKRHR